MAHDMKKGYFLPIWFCILTSFQLSMLGESKNLCKRDAESAPEQSQSLSQANGHQIFSSTQFSSQNKRSDSFNFHIPNF